VNQILKLHKFISRKAFDKQSVSGLVESAFYMTLSKGSLVPLPIKKLYSTYSEDKLLTRLQDPTFLYESVKLCSECYEHFKALLQLIKDVKKKSSRKEESKKGGGIIPSIPKSHPTAMPRLYKMQNEEARRQ